MNQVHGITRGWSQSAIKGPLADPVRHRDTDMNETRVMTTSS